MLMRAFTMRFDAARDGLDDAPATNFIKAVLSLRDISSCATKHPTWRSSSPMSRSVKPPSRQNPGTANATKVGGSC